MRLFQQLTGIATLLVIGVMFVLGDLWMLLVITPLVHLRPGLRPRVLGSYAQFIAGFVIALVRHIGRARIELKPTVPARGGVIMVMNHQSVIDIPAAVRCMTSAYPRMVARARYGRGIPLVSHMISLYGHILVQPGRTGRSELERLAETARASTLPILIFPEGHRTRDGEISPWKRAGLESFLSAREWSVYVLVVDGLWGVARLGDFVRNITRVRARIEVVGPIEYDGRGRERHTEFINHLHHVMCDKLAEMRTVASGTRSTESVMLSRE